MASDIKLENGHLALVNGDFMPIDKLNRIIQQIYIGLRLLVADWVLDETAGVNYLGGLRMYPEILSAQIKNAIATVEGVDTVLKYNFYIDENRIYRVAATVKIGNSEIPINDEINPITLTGV